MAHIAFPAPAGARSASNTHADAWRIRMPGFLPRRMKFWGWGFEGEGATPEERTQVHKLAATRFGATSFDDRPPRAKDFKLRKPRVAVPAALKRFCTDAALDRLVHA